MTRSPAARIVVAALALLAAGCGAKPPWPAAPASRLALELRVEPTTARLLEPITVTLDLFALAGVDAEFAPAVDAKDFLATVTAAPAVSLHGGTWRRTTIVCRPVRGPGELVLPPFVAKSKDGVGAASTPETRITVLSSLEGAGAAIEAPGAPLPPPFQGWWWLVGIAAALALAASAWWLLRRAQTARHEPHEVALPPHVKAQRALERLRGQRVATLAEIEQYYVQVSQILRVYLEERFGLRAPERTTEEFLRELEGGSALAKNHRRELERFLSQCDLVKFAAVVPGPAEHQAVFELAAAFVEATRGDRAEPEAAA
jgi:hypothetical protein